jgi:hypothetical protein
VKGAGETKVSGHLLDFVQHLNGGVQQFRADAVAGDHDDIVGFH